MKTKINVAVLALLICTPALSDAAGTGQEHSTLVKSMMAQNSLAKCRSSNLQAMATELIEKNNGCPKDLDVNALLDKAANSCTAQYDAARKLYNEAFTYSIANADEANAATDKQMEKDKLKWQAKASKPLTEACQK